MNMIQSFFSSIEKFHDYIDEGRQNIGKPASDDTKALKRRHSNDNDKSKKKRVEEGKISDLLLWTLD